MGRFGEAKALTRGGRGPYHWGMGLGPRRGKMVNAGTVLLVAMSFAGCEDAAKRPVQALSNTSIYTFCPAGKGMRIS